MNDLLEISENFSNELYLEYLMPVSNVNEIYRQLVICSKNVDNSICDYIIGVDLHVHYTRKSCKCRVYLKFEKKIIARKSDFFIIFDEIFIYPPTSLPIQNTIEIVLYIADFAVGEKIGNDLYFYDSFYMCTRLRLIFSPRIKNFLYSSWRERIMYVAMLERLDGVLDPKTFPCILFALMVENSFSESLDYLIDENPMEYLRGSQEYEKKLQNIQYLLINFRKNYAFNSYSVPFHTNISLTYLEKWVVETASPKILVLVGTYCCSRTKVVLNFISSQLNQKVRNILTVNSSAFLFNSTFLFLDYMALNWGSIDIKTDDGLLLRKQLNNKIIKLIIKNITSSFILKDSTIKNLELTMNNNLIVYDLENDLISFKENSNLDDYFCAKSLPTSFIVKISSFLTSFFKDF
jgi:hypothetical protein